ncbi:MAG: c-type cytochrome [Verrucomicrobiae bacterium]|nr:c-type cytochrome [Verrucomicrobiae bacterium]
MPPSRRPFAALLAAAIACSAVGAAEPDLQREEIPRYPPLNPGEALAAFVVKPGFRIELAAHEPAVVDPIALAFDEHGRGLVIEMRDYSERRPEQLGRVRRIEDRDGDGHFETGEVFLEDLPWPTAIACWDGGVFVGATPDIWYAKDTTGDGRADLREIVFTGFASQFAPYATNRLNVQAMLNSFRWGLDNRIHGSSSLSGGQVRAVDSAFTRAWRAKAGLPPLDPERSWDLRGRDFSLDPRTLEFRPETGGGQHGMSFDSTGRKFLCSNSDHLQWARYEEHHAARNTAGVLGPARVSIAADGPAAEVFRLSPEEPWRIIRTRWRVTGLVAGLIEGGGRSSGYFTSATGLTLYRGDAFGPDFADDAFVADCGSNLVHRKKIRAEGSELIGERPSDERDREFLASRDTWFRPVDFVNAPDGCLWVIDMYREIIEHPWSLPPNLKRHLDLNAGNDLGRLYRVAPAQQPIRRQVGLAGLTTPEYVALLGHPNGWHRDTAARLLLERADPEAPALLRGALRGAAFPMARLHALYVLDSLGGLQVSDLGSALGDASEPVRRHAVRLAERRLTGRGPTEIDDATWTALAGDEPFVRLELAFALGTLQVPQRTALLARLIRTADSQPREQGIVEAAILSAGDDTLALFRALLRDNDLPHRSGALAALARTLGRRNRPDERATMLDVLLARSPERSVLHLATRFVEGLRQAGAEAAVLVPGDPRWQGIHALALTLAASPEAATDLADRLDAVRWLGLMPTPSGFDRLALLATLAGSTELPRAAVEALFRTDESRAWDALLPRWSQLAAPARLDALEITLRRPAGMDRVLDALAGGTLTPRDLTATQIAGLRRHPDAARRERAMELLGAPAPSRTEALATALAALDLPADPRRGFAVHQAQCAPCHRLAGYGHVLGPDLESVRSQPREKLLVGILDPNREVASAFLATTVETTDGESLTGVIVSESADGLVLRQASGLETSLPRQRILRQTTEPRSLMPEGFETTLTPQELADLLACLTDGVPVALK